MEDPLWKMRMELLDALDQISSPRSSMETRSKALEKIERHMAQALASKEETAALDHIMALQHTFECNVPLRLLSWISLATARLETLARASMDETQEQEASALASQLSQSLNLIQGITLSHTGTKDYLGRKYPIEVLLDLLLASRHLPSSTSDPEACRKLSLDALPLTSVVLDTLLCILVDSSTALRAFEDVNGPQAVVRILKRATTPREVRMKCLEFLYFYLLDETSPAGQTAEDRDTDSENGRSTPPSSRGFSTSKSTPVAGPTANGAPTAPATPVRPTKKYLGIGATPRRPPSAWNASGSYPSSEVSNSMSTPNPRLYLPSTSGGSSRSTSGSSVTSFASNSSNASSSTAATSTSGSPDKTFGSGRSALRGLGSDSPRKTPISSSSSAARLLSERVLAERLSRTPSSSTSSSTTIEGTPTGSTTPLPRLRLPPSTPTQQRLGMLKKDVDYEPMSPKKSSASSGLGISPRGHAKSKSMSNVLSGSPTSAPTVGPRHGSSSAASGFGKAAPGGSSGTAHVRSRLGPAATVPDVVSRQPSSTGASTANSSMVFSEESSIDWNSRKSSLGLGLGRPGGWSEEGRMEGSVRRRTTEEKKELLGTMLGNVDALVEGVRKAGIWGLG